MKRKAGSILIRGHSLRSSHSDREISTVQTCPHYCSLRSYLLRLRLFLNKPVIRNTRTLTRVIRTHVYIYCLRAVTGKVKRFLSGTVPLVFYPAVRCGAASPERITQHRPLLCAGRSTDNGRYLVRILIGLPSL